MGGIICILLAALLVVTLAYVIMRFRLRRLTRQAEDFLTVGGQPLAFSVREDALAPVHNAVAELENRVLLSKELQAEECRRTSDLTADISHQLKTPLAALKLYCELDDGAHLEDELAQIERMEKLIYALLRLERLCADGYSFNFAEHDIGEIIREAWSGVSAAWPDRKLSVEGNAIIRCDEKWMGEVFGNLFKNACEHTANDGMIWVFMETTNSAFYCTVEDDGGGVDPKELPHLFERFYRAASRETKGSGLGLAIVREIVERHHGSVHAENTQNGLRIGISIPLLNLAKS